eukprot:gene5056-18273_t
MECDVSPPATHTPPAVVLNGEGFGSRHELEVRVKKLLEETDGGLEGQDLFFAFELLMHHPGA